MQISYIWIATTATNWLQNDSRMGVTSSGIILFLIRRKHRSNTSRCNGFSWYRFRGQGVGNLLWVLHWQLAVFYRYLPWILDKWNPLKCARFMVPHEMRTQAVCMVGGYARNQNMSRLCSGCDKTLKWILLSTMASKITVIRLFVYRLN